MKRLIAACAVLASGAGLALTMATAAGAATTTTPAATTFNGCVNLKSGRVIDNVFTVPSRFPGCPSGSFQVTWGSQGPQGKTGPQGPQGPQGPAGPAGSDASMAGAFYSVENYVNGGDGWATAACDPSDDTRSQTFTAVSGGVQGYSDSANPSAAISVTNSFPGRMDWTTDTPKAGRLDGWVVGLTGGDDTTLKVWALCVPNADFGGSAPPVVVNNG
jgi:hypothetical protein